MEKSRIMTAPVEQLHLFVRKHFPTTGMGPRSQLFCGPVDSRSMSDNKPQKPASRCAYIRACYMAEDLKCFGYKTDCPLYQKSNGEYFDESRFHEAMNRLIDKARAKYANLPK